MKIEYRVRVLAGTLILLSLGLTYFFNGWWLALAGFVGVNLIQSAFTGFCPAEMILRRIWGHHAPHQAPATESRHETRS
jgi:hypothetical protein